MKIGQFGTSTAATGLGTKEYQLGQHVALIPAKDKLLETYFTTKSTVDKSVQFML